jgi:endonuclease/exonuclease/phosphatase (EEP) superfamily protein YafD
VIALGYAALCVPLYMPPPALATQDRAPLTLLSANLLYRSSDARPIADLIARTKPDVLVLQELTPRWRAALEPVLAAYPHQHEILSDDPFGIGVYSRSSFEVLDPELDHPPMIAARIAHAGRAVTLLAVHTIPPVNEHAALLRDRQLDHIAKLAQRAQSNVIVAGDLNTTSWSRAFTKMLNASGLIDTRRGLGIQGSWHSSWPAPLRIPIDHVLTSSDVVTLRREIAPDTGSDHRAVFVELSLWGRTEKPKEL